MSDSAEYFRIQDEARYFNIQNEIFTGIFPEPNKTLSQNTEINHCEPQMEINNNKNNQDNLYASDGNLSSKQDMSFKIRKPSIYDDDSSVSSQETDKILVYETRC